MNEDFEQRLRTLFAAADPPSISERFGGEVRARIVGLRRARRIVLATAFAAAGLAAATFAASLIATATTFIAAAPVTLNGPLSALLLSPAGFALGALTVVAALVDVLSE
jgi:hypothetical protein